MSRRGDRLVERGEKTRQSGRRVTGIVYGTFFSLILLWIIYEIGLALWPG